MDGRGLTDCLLVYAVGLSVSGPDPLARDAQRLIQAYSLQGRARNVLFQGRILGTLCVRNCKLPCLRQVISQHFHTVGNDYVTTSVIAVVSNLMLISTFFSLLLSSPGSPLQFIQT